jgi:hypothetical protein
MLTTMANPLEEPEDFFIPCREGGEVRLPQSFEEDEADLAYFRASLARALKPPDPNTLTTREELVRFVAYWGWVQSLGTAPDSPIEKWLEEAKARLATLS